MVAQQKGDYTEGDEIAGRAPGRGSAAVILSTIGASEWAGEVKDPWQINGIGVFMNGGRFLRVRL
jgi:hypothetical protein